MSIYIKKKTILKFNEWHSELKIKAMQNDCFGANIAVFFVGGYVAVPKQSFQH